MESISNEKATMCLGQFRYKRICTGKQYGWDGRHDLWVFPQFMPQSELLRWTVTMVAKCSRACSFWQPCSQQQSWNRDLGISDKPPINSPFKHKYIEVRFSWFFVADSQKVSDPKKVFITQLLNKDQSLIRFIKWRIMSFWECYIWLDEMILCKNIDTKHYSS